MILIRLPLKIFPVGEWRDNVNIKPMLRRQLLYFQEAVKMMQEEKCSEPDLNRTLWLHEMSLHFSCLFCNQLRFLYINNIISASFSFLEVSCYKMNDDCVCTEIGFLQFFPCSFVVANILCIMHFFLLGIEQSSRKNRNFGFQANKDCNAS